VVEPNVYLGGQGHGQSHRVPASRFVWGVTTVSRQPLWVLLFPWRCTNPPELPVDHHMPGNGRCLRDSHHGHTTLLASFGFGNMAVEPMQTQ